MERQENNFELSEQKNIIPDTLQDINKNISRNNQQTNYNTTQENMQDVPVECLEEERPTVSKFFGHIMSVDETRISVLMIALVFSLGFGAYMYAVTNEVSQHWINIIETFALCVTGINVANTMANNNFFQNVLGNRYNQQQNNTFQRNSQSRTYNGDYSNYQNNNLRR